MLDWMSAFTRDWVIRHNGAILNFFFIFFVAYITGTKRCLHTCHSQYLFVGDVECSSTQWHRLSMLSTDWLINMNEYDHIKTADAFKFNNFLVVIKIPLRDYNKCDKFAGSSNAHLFTKYI